MTNIWFTSDQHYFHTNIIKYCNRPFASVKEMDQAMIEKYNSLVKPKDIVYHLGDFGYATSTAAYLNGVKHLIIGNHDWKILDDLKPHFVWCRDTFRLKINGNTFWLAHYPHRAWPQAFHGAYHLFGHVHGRLPDYGRSCDVGVDVWNYAPVHIDQIIERLKDARLEKDDGEEL